MPERRKEPKFPRVNRGLKVNVSEDITHTGLTEEQFRLLDEATELYEANKNKFGVEKVEDDNDWEPNAFKIDSSIGGLKMVGNTFHVLEPGISVSNIKKIASMTDLSPDKVQQVIELYKELTDLKVM
jgi:hypothetical protein